MTWSTSRVSAWSRLGHEMRREQARPYPIERRRMRDQPAGCRPPRGRGLQPLALVMHPHAQQPDPLVAPTPEVGERRIELTGFDLDVGIEEQDGGRGAGAGALIAGGREPDVFLVAEPGELRRRAGEPVGRSVGRGIVDHHHVPAGLRRGLRLRERTQARAQEITRVPIDDHDIQINRRRTWRGVRVHRHRRPALSQRRMVIHSIPLPPRRPFASRTVPGHAEASGDHS